MLPTGTVTFLFTDIEGSTRLWEQHPEAMRFSLARHDAILRTAIESHGGHVFKTIGDAFCAAFPTAPLALAAAIAFQRSLRDEPWGETGPLRVRTALNTGAAEERDGDYFGPPLNRVARLLSAGHGGQILLAAATREAAKDGLPVDVALRDLGDRRLKDLTQPEHVFQVYAPDLPSDFPPLKTLDTRPNNLPAQPTLFIGREHDLEAVSERLRRPEVRLLTLIGPGGIGKTRLALQVAADMLSTFDDGMFFVSLSSLRDHALVMATVAQVLDIREVPGQPILETLKEQLREKKLLLIMDNFEHVAAAALELADLLGSCPHLKLLVTSRVPLRLRGEHHFEVPALGLPSPDESPAANELSRYEAVRLFVARARETLWDFAVTGSNAAAVAGICRRLDGLPLAIELAAARVGQFSPEQMLPRLEHRLGLLTEGAIDLPERQQTMRGAVAWSYELLERAEQKLFARLSVFAGGCTLAAAEKICDHDLHIAVRDGLESLASKSLIRVVGEGEHTRYRMLETIREYGQEQLDSSGEVSAVRPQHVKFFLGLAEEAEPQLTGPEQASWIKELEVEHDNLRGALRWALDGQNAEAGARIAGSLWRFWAKRGYLSEGRGWLERSLAAMSSEQTEVTAHICRGAGNLAWRQGDYEAAWRYHQESRCIHLILEDKHGIVRDLANLGNVAMQRGDHAESLSLNEACLTMARELGDQWHVAIALNNMGVVKQEQGDYKAARVLYEECLAIWREMGDTGYVALVLLNLSEVAAYLGDFTTARAYCEESLAIYRAQGEKQGMANSLVMLGTIDLWGGDHEWAPVHGEESLSICREIGDKRGGAEALELLAAAAASGARCPERAAYLFAAAGALRDRVSAPLPPVRRPAQQKIIAEVKACLGEEAFAAMWEKGREMSFEQAADYALAYESSHLHERARVA